MEAQVRTPARAHRAGGRGPREQFLGLHPLTLSAVPHGSRNAGQAFQSGHQRPPRGAQKLSMADTCWPDSQGPSSFSDGAPW